MIRLHLVSSFSALVLAGCASSFNAPLCPAIAQNSFDEPQANSLINRYMIDQAKSRDVKLSILSPFIVEVSGASDRVEWFKQNYKFMLCAFNPKIELEDRATYLSCMNHADSWIKIVQSETPDRLMLTQTKFKENCVRSGRN